MEAGRLKQSNELNGQHQQEPLIYFKQINFEFLTRFLTEI